MELWNKKIYVACSALWKVQMRCGCGWTPGNGGWRESNVKGKESGIWCNQTRVQYLFQLLSNFVNWIESVNISEPLFSFFFFYDRDMGRPLIHTPLWMLSLAKKTTGKIKKIWMIKLWNIKEKLSIVHFNGWVEMKWAWNIVGTQQIFVKWVCHRKME